MTETGKRECVGQIGRDNHVGARRTRGQREVDMGKEKSRENKKFSRRMGRGVFCEKEGGREKER